ncbi:MFS general substrate transporter [Russula earlei]|uniref:MFS general substrate transporter n=1 Tax=Russula earlei TaxID=71964 RepID=A0ACC0U524_9AGAM|nr:MFS general substrate transporter [Russula earlei]
MGSPRAGDIRKVLDSGCPLPTASSSQPIPAVPPTDPSREGAPDGGTLAWLQVAASFFVLMNTWGIINTFGAYHHFYQLNILRSHSPSAISWIGSIQGYLLMTVGALTGPFFDAGYSRALLAVGSFLTVLGLMMTSQVKQYYQAFLAQGVCFGIGAGMLFVPSIAVVSTYFDKHRSLAVGITASGSGLGGVIYPALFHSLQPRIGFPWTTRIIGLMALVTLAFANLVTRQRVLPATRRKLFDVSALREPPFMLCAAGFLFGFMGLYIPFFYITPYAHFKTGASAALAFYFVPILNAGSVFGRILPNALADRIGPLNTLIPCTFACGVLAFAWTGVHGNVGLLAFAILYGFFSGTFVSLPPSAIVYLSSDLHKVGTRLGMSFGISGLGVLIGSPVGGALLNLGTGHFVRAQVFCAVTMMTSCAFLVLARLTNSGRTLLIKA